MSPKKNPTPPISKREKNFKNNQIPRKVKLSDGQILEVSASKAGSILSKNMGQHQNPKGAISTEGPNEVVGNEDGYDKLQYPPPSDDPVFRKFWAEGIESITSRSNFMIPHLGLFETFCSLRAEIRKLDDFIKTHGIVYRIVTQMGEVRKPYPEVVQRRQAQSQLAAYAKLLDMTPAKDKGGGAPTKKEDEDNWS